jgi:hypothetical protein
LRQWVIDGPAKQRLDRANWTYAELADHLFTTRGVRVQKSAMQAFCSRHDIRPYLPLPARRPGQAGRGPEDLADLGKKRRRANSSC